MFGERLRQLRTEHGYSMDYLADIYNKKYNGKLNKSTISRYENELQEPMLFVVNNLADLFSVSVDYLTGKETPTPVPESGHSGKNVIRAIGRDGSVTERYLSDEQLAAYKAMLSTLPDADDL